MTMRPTNMLTLTNKISFHPRMLIQCVPQIGGVPGIALVSLFAWLNACDRTASRRHLEDADRHRVHHKHARFPDGISLGRHPRITARGLIHSDADSAGS